MNEEFFTSPPYEAYHHSLFNSLLGFLEIFKDRGSEEYLKNLYFKLRLNSRVDDYREPPGKIVIKTPKIGVNPEPFITSIAPNPTVKVNKKQVVMGFIEGGVRNPKEIQSSLQLQGINVSYEYICELLKPFKNA